MVDVKHQISETERDKLGRLGQRINFFSFEVQKLFHERIMEESESSAAAIIVKTPSSGFDSSFSPFCLAPLIDLRLQENETDKTQFELMRKVKKEINDFFKKNAST